MNGSRLKFIRKLRGLTQKQLGLMVDFPEKYAEIRIAQYESGRRTAKSDMLKKLSSCLRVEPEMLKIPEIKNDIQLMHILFQLEDMYGLTISEVDGSPCIRFRFEKQGDPRLGKMLQEWLLQAKRLQHGEITKQEYDEWRYNWNGKEDCS